MSKIAWARALAATMLLWFAVSASAEGQEHARRVILIIEGPTPGREAEAAYVATAAIMTGVKVEPWAIGVTGLSRGECDPLSAHDVPTLIEQAKDAGLGAGIVTTERITRRRPAAAYAHVSDIDWEVDSHMPMAALDSGCHDIARQLALFDHHRGLDVALGGGRLAFMPFTEVDPSTMDRRGVRQDGDDLISRWREHNPGRFVWTAAQLTETAHVSAGPLLGLFAPDDMTREGRAERPTSRRWRT